MTKTRPPPSVLLIHNGMPFTAHVAYLINAGLIVTEAHADQGLLEATTQQPDIIVLDFGCDGEMTAALKAHEPTAHIPVIALVDLVRPA